MRKLLFGMLFTATTLCANSAFAAPPPSVVGNWPVIANQTAGALIINFQAAAGICRQISGTIFGNPVSGFYCPATGRIHFLRKSAANNDTFQSYIGNVGDDAATDRMAGTFAASPGGGVLGEYNFYAHRP